MRIRKNARISPLVYPASSPNAGAVVQTHICQLNQSPWDVMSFSPLASPPPPPPPPPPSQVHRNDVFAGSGLSPDNVPVVERKFSADEECKSMDTNKMVAQRHVVKGNSSREHHLSVAKSFSNVNESKKSEKSAAEEAPRQTRPKKAPASSSNNPNQFYYYSGFGPYWHKKRGQSNKNAGSHMSQNVEHELELNLSLLSQFDEDSDSFDDEDGCGNRQKGKKRGRKPIKARLLNSLM